MKFEEALPALRQPNKVIRRKDNYWQEQYGFLYIASPLPSRYSCNIVLETETQYGYNCINNLDWRADDWEVIDMVEHVMVEEMAKED